MIRFGVKSVSKIVCNIPHSNTAIPDWAIKDIVFSPDELADLIAFMTDKDIDKLWEFVPNEDKQLATVSRLVVDVERFRNDADEEMAQKGMGLYYTLTPTGERFRIKNEKSYKHCLEIYDEYHATLAAKVEEKLADYDKCIIFDCHSFHDEMTYTGFDIKTFPDVCIGTNDYITNETKIIVDAFRSKGYTVKINEPFSGSLVPLKYINDNRVVSIMIELNRRIYNNTHFSAVQNICREIYAKLK